MATTTTTTNKPLNPRAQDLSPKGYNRANIFSGKALSFDGVNDLVEVTEAASLDFATNFTYVAYVNLAASQNSRIFYSNYFDPTSVGAGFGISDTTNNQVKFYTKGSGASNTLLSSTLLNIGQWYQVITTYDGATKKMYINGRLDASAAYTDSVTYTSATNRVGALSGVSGQFFSGLIAGLRVFNTALTPAQVSDLYLNPEKIVPDGVASSALKLWLPMMEGAGASAYDGSGNGNDGTINGATWAAGIGAPVAQTALVSWNKGQNLVQYSEDFTDSFYNKASIAVTANNTTAPNGTATADKIAVSGSGTLSPNIFSAGIACTSGVAYKISYFAKQGASKYAKIRFSSTAFSGSSIEPIFDLNAGVVASGTGTIESVGNGWYLVSATATAVATATGVVTLDLPSATGVWPNGTFAGTEYIYAWGYSFRPASAGDAYIKTNATAQTSAVLVPEGLTAGASIFGTDIITPRNAFALNLDGASWAQSHDNASVDLAYPATLEVWTYQFGGQLSANNVYMPLFDKAPTSNGGSGITLRRYSQTQSNGNGYLGIGGSFFVFGSLTYNAWNHIVAVVESGSQKIYVNGALVSTTTNAYTLSVNAEPVRIGYAPSDGVQYFYGSLANPRIYNRALTAAEVLRNYNADRPKFGL